MVWGFDPVPLQLVSAALDDPVAHSLSADQYWETLRPRLQDFGISRVADITGLDHVGLPVVQAVRPRARSNAVTQGKATTLAAAAVGAVLECLEMAAGEDVTRLPKAPPGDPALWRALAPGADWPTPDSAWVAAWDLSRDGPAVVPRDILSTDFSVGAEAGTAPILRHSIGLGAGGSLAAALYHGLLECIEADARLRSEHAGTARRIGLDGVAAPLATMLRDAGLRVALSDLTRGGVPVVMASVMEAPGASALPLPAVGYAARSDPTNAIQAAIMEALQARLAAISGAREDLTQRFYTHDFSTLELEAEWQRHAPLQGPHGISATDATLRDLAQSVGPIFAVPLYWDPDLPLAITRILAPSLIADPLRLEAAL